MELEQARKEINRIDKEMAELFAARMRVVEEIAAYKQAHDLPICDVVREEQVVRQNSMLIENPEVRPHYIQFMQGNLERSRSHQEQLLETMKAAQSVRPPFATQPPAAPAPMGRILQVHLQGHSYDIILERGALARVGELLSLDRRVLIVTDDGVPAEYARTVAGACASPTVITLPQGEGTKSLFYLEQLLRTMMKEEFTRADCVVAVGGGVIGDLAGFAAASYMRGIDFYNIPTTVLSQVDSSVGGKVAVNLDGVKNLVGAFYQPKRVLIDPDVLATLPRRQIANGLAEALKMSLTSDAELFSLFEAGVAEAQIDTVIERALRIKMRIVEVDEKETGLRRVLNFGHTLGHGIEAAEELHGLYHGECVALGMLPMCAPEVRRRLLPVLASLGLPTVLSADLEEVLALAAHDKKRAGDSISVVWVERVGTFEMRTMPLSLWQEQIRNAMKEAKA